MPRRGPKARSLSIFLIKEDRTVPQDVIVDTGSLISSHVTLPGTDLSEIYIDPSEDRLPSWLSLFEGTLNTAIRDIHNASAAAVFLIRAAGRVFALTFGYGRNLLRPGVWEEDFGLRVTLNAVDPSRIRSVDRVKFDAISQHSQIQASRDANIVEFGLDVEQDLLRAVTGKPRDPALARQMTGKDALKVDVKVLLRDLPALLTRILETYSQTTYRQNFPWVDQVHEIRDVEQTTALDAILIDRIRARSFERLWLAIPDRVDWEGMAGFKYRDTKHAGLYSDIHFQTFLQEEGESFVPTIEALKNRKRVHLVSYEGEFVESTWSLYRCIYCEIDADNQIYLLNNGKWYRIQSDFLRNVTESYSSVLTTTLQLPDFCHANEAAYNSSVSESQPDDFFLMDQKLIRFPTGMDPIEFCDLYGISKLIIHVKKYRGSATLSHLFSQGVVSGELFCTLPQFREEVNRILSDRFRILDVAARPDNEEFEVVFGIISKSRKPLELPFFSKVNLRNTIHRLRAYGYKVSLTKIQDVGPARE